MSRDYYKGKTESPFWTDDMWAGFRLGFLAGVVFSVAIFTIDLIWNL